MSRIAAALLMPRRRSLVVFAMAELLLALAIPFVLIRGYHTLLDSRAGTFVEEPTRADPGWAALVDPSEVIGVAEVDRGVVTGVTLVVHNPQVASVGSVIIVPGTLDVGGTLLADRSPEEAVLAVSEAIRLGVDRIDVLDETGWAAFLGPTSYRLENPDPVPSDDDGVLVPVGSVEVGADVASAFVGRPASGAVPVSVLPRRHLLWSALLAEPPAVRSADAGGSTSSAGAARLAADLAEIDHARSNVVDLPVTRLEPVAVLDPDGAEALVREVVAFPAGAIDGDRLRVRIVDRSGGADLESLAADVAAQGYEVIEIANAEVFDGGATQVVVPITLTDANGSLPPDLAQLTALVSVDEVTIDVEPVDELVVTVVVGSDVGPIEAP